MGCNSSNDTHIRAPDGEQKQTHQVWSTEAAEFAKAADRSEWRVVASWSDLRRTSTWTVNYRGEVVLHRLADTKDIYYTKETATAFLKSGANIEARDSKGQTPLHMAWSEEMCELLLTYGADVEARDVEGRTPLMCAAARPSMRMGGAIIQMLIRWGADPYACDAKGRNACQLASNETHRVALARESLLERKCRCKANIPITIWCDECRESMCTACDLVVHSRTERVRTHHRRPTGIICAVDREQRAEIYCLHCGEFFCRACDAFQHAAHRVSRDHTRYSSLGPMACVPPCGARGSSDRTQELVGSTGGRKDRG